VRIRTTILVFILLIAVNGLGQDNKWRVHPELGCTWSDNFFAEAGIMRSWTGSKEGDPLALMGYKLAVVSNFNNNHFIVGPKISAEVDLLFISVRANVTDYICSGINDIRVTPEAGLTLLGFVTLCVGYNAPLLDTRINGISNVELSLNINLNRAYFDMFKTGDKS
jgi:hypothetical protein